MTARKTKPAKRRAKGAAKRARIASGMSTRRKAGSSKEGTKTNARKKTRSRKRSRRAVEPKALSHLGHEEARELLQILIGRHPELRAEYEQLAREIADRADPEKLAHAVHQRLLALGSDDLAARSGRRQWGYVEPEEAAQELLDGVMEPYFEELRRLIELGLEVAARAQCLGVVVGLFRARGAEFDSPLAYAPDFCENEAAHVVEVLAKQSARKFGQRWTLPGGYESELAEWGWLFR